MIDFQIRKSDSLCGGLNFQIVGNYENCEENKHIDLEKINFCSSFCISEHSFLLIEYFFSKHSKNGFGFYHYDTHFHDKKSIKKIIIDINSLLDRLKENNSFNIKLNWYTEEFSKFLEKNKNLENFRKKLFFFLEKIVNLLKEFYENPVCFGIYVIGI